MSAHHPSVADLELSRVVSLPSGRDVVIQSGKDETIEVRSPDGTIEVSIALTEHGPVLRVTGGTLQMQADTLSLKGRRVDIDSSELTTISSGGEVVVVAPMIRLN